MDTLSSDQKLSFIKSCPTNVYETDENYENVSHINDSIILEKNDNDVDDDDVSLDYDCR